jgi:hypothetical protein
MLLRAVPLGLGIEALYRKPRTSILRGKRRHTYLLSSLAIERPNHSSLKKAKIFRGSPIGYLLTPG